MAEEGLPSSLFLRSQAKGIAQISQGTWETDHDLEKAVERHKAKKQTWPVFWGLAYRSIGVIYGDLGTSPLYTFPTVFAREPTRLAIYGSCSLILWILLLQLVLKYVCITLYADDQGEGGTFAMYSLLCRHIGITPFGRMDSTDASLSRYSPRSQNAGEQKSRGSQLASFIRERPCAQQGLLLLVLFGTSMLIGDGVLTCAIEVVSAVSGLEMKAGVSQGVIVGISCVVLILLFSIQRLGTSKIGILFSPILFTWFISNSALGVYNIAKYNPGIFAAFNPAYGFRYLVNEGKPAWLSLGGVILCVTGAEAMFSDLGHFSRPAIQLTTLAVVLPSCMLTYLGEAAYLTAFPKEFTNPYFAAVPSNWFWFFFVVATASSVVAAQSLITATYSIVKQSVALNCFPPVEVVQTSDAVSGQVYLPFVSWGLMVGSIAVVAGFQSTTSIGNAFGVAFISVMMVSTLLVCAVQVIVWKLNPVFTLVFGVFFICMEGVPASALLYKVPHGAWFPLALGAVIVAVSYLWHYGASQKLAYSIAHRQQLPAVLRGTPNGSVASELELVGNGLKVARVPGLALYHSENLHGLPEAFSILIPKLPAVHQTVIFLTLRQVPLPKVAPEERFLIRSFQIPGFFRAVARYGYLDVVDHGPEFVSELTMQVATLVRYTSLTGRALTVDSAIDIPGGPPEQLGTRTRREEFSSRDPALVQAQGLELQTRGVHAEAFSDSAADIPVVAMSSGEAAASSDGAHPPEDQRRGSLGGDSVEAEALLGQRSPDFDAANVILRSPEDGVLYVLSRSTLLAKEGSSFFRRLLLETLYPFLVRNSHSTTAKWKIPVSDVVEVGVIHKA